MDDQYFMKKALDQANIAFKKGEVPVGAIVVSEGKIIAKGYNLTEALVDVTAHAEMQVITAASAYISGKYLTNCTLYVTLEPCQMCAGATNWAQISRIVFGASDENRGFETLKTKLHPKTEIVKGVLEKECSSLLTKFFIEKRNLN